MIKPILNDDDLGEALNEIRDLMDAQLGTPAGARLETLVALVETYEAGEENCRSAISELRNCLLVASNWPNCPESLTGWIRNTVLKNTP